MSVFQAIILGVVQGIAEFLPISSSGHLAVAQRLFGLEDVPLLFDVMIHLATLAAVILYFRKKIARLFAILFRWILPSGKRKTENGKMEVGRGKLELENEVGKAFPSATMASPFSPTPSPGGKPPSPQPESKSDARLSYEEKKKLEAEKRKAEKKVSQIEEEIARTEEEKQSEENKMADPKVYSNGEKAKAVQAKIALLSQKLDELNEQWEAAAMALEEF